ncbi:unnamed protein product [Bursaphelenchus okinawaensis]|uniref:glycine--tRNA ligase n=1 Tax=Bursaphelenchus okinawaensis TaxID=465554 RepID=A0A811K719_9BILA|nr:unnamed protein product [Bursaphelenchus okinawaensis]CAG9092765.1 unnamed protein product [Bursaphelenchus okinawaensis]
MYKLNVISRALYGGRLYSESATQRKLPTKRLREKISVYLKVLGSPTIESKLIPYKENVRRATEQVEEAKRNNDSEAVKQTVDLLKNAKEQLQIKEYELMPENGFVDQLSLYDLLTNRFFFDRSFTSQPGLIDLGPAAVAIKNNIVNEWRRHFIKSDRMLEVECPSLTPAEVLKASGHVDRFTDFIVKDVKTNDTYRADHLIKEHLEALLKDKKLSREGKEKLEKNLSQVETLNADELHSVIEEFGLKSKNGNELSRPTPLNLMFAAQLGGQGENTAYLRPETSQGIFLNFRKLLAYNGQRLPLTVAQVGTVFRNEVSPKHNLFRLREFTLCEIEHFYTTSDDIRLKLDKLLDMEFTLWSAEDQEAEKSSRNYTVKGALENNVISNVIIAYYMIRSAIFLTKIGIDPQRLRFRQHRRQEMAHYANDCWDAEALTTVGWVELAGFSDRSSYDLKSLSQGLNIYLSISSEDLEYPKVVEPSFGIGRILQTVLEHSFRQRNPDSEPKNPYFAFPLTVAPILASIYPIVRDDKFNTYITDIEDQLKDADISFNVVDTRYSIGKRYIKADELGIPFGITVDDNTVNNGTVTIREITTMQQITVPVTKVGQTLSDLIKGRTSWDRLK